MNKRLNIARSKDVDSFHKEWEREEKGNWIELKNK